MPNLIVQDPPATCRRLEVLEADLRAIDAGDMARMSFLLHLIRQFETRVLELKDADLIQHARLELADQVQ